MMMSSTLFLSGAYALKLMCVMMCRCSQRVARIGSGGKSVPENCSVTYRFSVEGLTVVSIGLAVTYVSMCVCLRTFDVSWYYHERGDSTSIRGWRF